MPLYDFRCADCGNVSEILIRTRSEEPSSSCPKCGSKRLERLLSAPHIPKAPEPAVTRCGKGSTCCGSSTPCDKPPCS